MNHTIDTRVRGLLAGLTAVLLLAVASGCVSDSSERDGSQLNPLIVRMGTAEVYLDEFDFYRKQNYPEIEGNNDPELHSFVFDKFRRDLLIAQISQGLGFRITGDQVDQFINYKMTGMSFHLLPPEEQLLFRKEIKRRLAIQQFLEREIVSAVTVADEEINRHYEAHQEDFRKEALFRVRFMQARDEARASEFLDVLKKGRESFVDVAKDYAENEGYDLVVPVGLNELPAPFIEPLSELKPGQYTKIIPIQHGETAYYYVLYLESLIPAEQISFEEAYQHIRKKLEKECSDRLLEEKVQQFEPHIPTKIFWDRLPFKYVEAAKRKEV